jgi:2-deoxy-D-gluconate 3-dehydrogenase
MEGFMKLFDLSGKVALVTGGNGGIGKGCARALAECGAAIAIAARNEEKTAKACAELRRDFGVRAEGFVVDLHYEDQIRAMVAKAIETFGRLDILVNNAGMNIRKLPQEYRWEEFEEVLTVNLKAAFICSQAVYPAMKAAGGGKIICIGSLTSILAGVKMGAYGTSKGGLMQMAKALAVAWAPDNIQVNTILPGWIETDLTTGARRDMPGLDERVLARSPAGRWGRPDDVGGVAAFLASRASDFVTGVAMPVDGGYSTLVF